GAGEFFVAEVLDDAADAALPAITAALTDTQCPERDIEIVRRDDQLRKLDLIEIDQAAHRDAAVVHVGLRLDQQNAPVTDHAIGDLRLFLAARERQGIAAREVLDRPETAILAGLRGVGPRTVESYGHEARTSEP